MSIGTIRRSSTVACAPGGGAIPRALWPVIRRRLDYLHAATRLDQLTVHRLEALKGDQRGRYSIRVNRQYRITFGFDAGHADEVCCEDYH